MMTRAELGAVPLPFGRDLGKLLSDHLYLTRLCRDNMASCISLRALAKADYSLIDYQAAQQRPKQEGSGLRDLHPLRMFVPSACSSPSSLTCSRLRSPASPARVSSVARSSLGSSNPDRNVLQVNCGACVAKDKAIKRYSVRTLAVEASGVQDLSDASVYPE